MDIYKARKLQNLLFQSSEVDFKRIGTIFNAEKTKLAYYVLHFITKDCSMTMSDRDFIRMMLSTKMGAIVKIDYISEEMKRERRFNDPAGFYIVEIIEID